MKNEVTLHFGGLWAVVGEPADDRRLRTALHFFGQMYLVFLDFEKPNRIIQSMYHYVLGDGVMSMQQLHHESKEESPIVEVEWRLVNDGLLEFVENGKTSLWEPVSAEQLAEEGYPMQLFESLRRAFVDLGSFYTDALAPHPSSFAALRAKGRRD
jgi:hypothetical protein